MILIDGEPLGMRHEGKMEENEKGTVQIRMKEKKQNKTVWEGIKRLKKKEVKREKEEK